MFHERPWKKIVVCTMKNEGPYLLEWIAHYLSIGFDGFIVFSNDCADGSNLMLEHLDNLGIIEHYDNPMHEGGDPQRKAYSRANRTDTYKAAEWVFVADADEYLNIHIGDGSVDDLIKYCNAPDAISIVWRLMGSSGHSKFEDGFTVDRFTHGSNFENPENGLVGGFKTLFRPEKFDYFGVHRPRFKKDKDLSKIHVTWTNGAGEDIAEKYKEKGWRFGKDTLGYSYGQVNHYAIRSREEFLGKIIRGTANSGKNKGRIDLDYWKKYDLNGSYDATLTSEKLEPYFAKLIGEEVLGLLNALSTNFHRKSIGVQATKKDYRKFLEAK